MELIKLFGVCIVIAILFTIGDAIGHSYLEKNKSIEIVPPQYYTNKIYYGTILLFLAVLMTQKYNLSEYPRVFILTSIVVLTLQFRYYGLYSARFNYYIIVLHYIVLVPIIYFFQENKLI